jgi:hypothetical protein
MFDIEDILNFKYLTRNGLKLRFHFLVFSSEGALVLFGKSQFGAILSIRSLLKSRCHCDCGGVCRHMRMV